MWIYVLENDHFSPLNFEILKESSSENKSNTQNISNKLELATKQLPLVPDVVHC